MVTTPGFSETLAAEIVALYSRAHEFLLERMSARIARGVETPEWELRQQAELAEFRRQAENLVTSLSGSSATPITDAIRRAHAKGDQSAVAELGRLGRAPRADIDHRTVTNLAAQLHGRLGATHPGIVNASTAAYQRVIVESLSGTATGIETRQQAAQRALTRFARDGIRGVTDSAGRTWMIDTYVEMSTRTAMMNATIEGHSQRLTSEGEEFVMVSDHTQECKLCRPWEGKVLSLTGSTTGEIEQDGHSFRVEETLERARASGLFHPNCRHSYSLYLPGFTRSFGVTADPEGDKARQKLRRLEREKRALLRQKAAAITPEEKKAVNAKVRAKTEQIKAHVDATDGLKRSPNRESLTAAR